MLKLLNNEYITDVINKIDASKKEIDNFIDQLLPVLEDAIKKGEKTIKLNSIKGKFSVSNIKYGFLVDYCGDEQTDNKDIDLGRVIYYLFSPETVFNNYMYNNSYGLNNIWYNRDNVIKIYTFLYKVTNNGLLKDFIEKYNETGVLSMYGNYDIFFIEYDNNNLYVDKYDNKKVVFDIGGDGLSVKDVSFETLKKNREMLNFIYDVYRIDLTKDTINKYGKDEYVNVYNKALGDYRTKKSFDGLSSAMLNKKVETIFTEEDVYNKYKEAISYGDLIKRTVFYLYLFENKNVNEIVSIMNGLLNVLDKKYDSNYIFLSYLSDYDVVVKNVLSKSWKGEYNSILLIKHLNNLKDNVDIKFDGFDIQKVDIKKVEKEIFKLYQKLHFPR